MDTGREGAEELVALHETLTEDVRVRKELHEHLKSRLEKLVDPHEHLESRWNCMHILKVGSEMSRNACIPEEQVLKPR